MRITANTIECFHRGQRIASHRRSCHKARHTTVAAHMPEAHRQAGEWSPQRLGRWAAQIGPATDTLILRVLSARKHPQQAYRSCLGILRLGKTFGNDRLEAACQRSLTLGSHSYKSLESILRHGLDRQPLSSQTEAELPTDHDNIRGSIDDWGMDTLNTAQRHDLMHIADDRYQSASTMMVSQLPVDQWYATIGDNTLADAILDRLVHNAHRLTLKGESMRKKQGFVDSS